MTLPVAIIDLNALSHNFKQIKKQAPHSQIMSVVKANAYGHGLIPVARALSESDAFAVARVSEGVQLRQASISQPIVVLGGGFSATDLQLAADHALSIVFCHLAHIDLMATIKLSKPLESCWLMVETGMHRLGLQSADVDSALYLLNKSTNVIGEIGLMSHFANADSIDDSRNQKQLADMMLMVKTYHAMMSMANSAAILSMPDSHGDWVRPGLALYGISPFSHQSTDHLGLKPVMTFMATIVSIQILNKGDQVGYGGEWTARQATKTAIVDIGYGDGYNRQLSNKGQVFVRGKLVPVLGRVSMDAICIDVSSLSAVHVGDEVCLWGCDKLSVSVQAERAHTIAYELVCQVSDRVARRYHYG